MRLFLAPYARGRSLLFTTLRSVWLARKSEVTGKRGGIRNSVTRILLKPTHMIGGYAHQAFAFNYLGPTGNQRDIVSYIRRRKSQEVTFLNARYGTSCYGDGAR